MQRVTDGLWKYSILKPLQAWPKPKSVSFIGKVEPEEES